MKHDQNQVTFLEAETARIEQECDQAMAALDQELRDLDVEIRATRRTSKLGLSLLEKLEAKQEVRRLEETRNAKRRQLFDAQDALTRKRNELIKAIESELNHG